jgi:hypothetical protein
MAVSPSEVFYDPFYTKQVRGKPDDFSVLGNVHFVKRNIFQSKIATPHQGHKHFEMQQGIAAKTADSSPSEKSN